MKPSIKRSIVFVLAAVLFLGPVPSALAAPAPSPSRVEGRVFGTDLVTPAANLTVQAIPDGQKTPVATTATAKDGRFALQPLPAGAYVLLLADAKGTPLASARLDAKAGQSQSITLALPDRKAGEATSAPNRASFVGTPGGSALIVVGSALVLAFAAKSWADSDNGGQPTPSPSR